MNKKKTILIAVAAVLVVVLAAVAIFTFSPKITVDKSVIDNNTFKTNRVAEYVKGDLNLVENEYTLVGQSGDLQLLYNKTDFALKVVNTKTGEEWSSMVDHQKYVEYINAGKEEEETEDDGYYDDYYEEEESEFYEGYDEYDVTVFKKLFEIRYTDFAAIENSTSLIESYDAEVAYEKLKNGIAIKSRFNNCGISVTVEFWVDETGLNVRVPIEGIKEEEVDGKKYGLVNVIMLPMFGASTEDVKDGFLLFPDATGGIYDFKTVTDDTYIAPTTSEIYFSRDFNLDEIEENNRQGVKDAIMPYFGISHGTQGFVGYITEGDTNAYITLSPSGNVYRLNRIETAANYRKSFTYLNPSGETVTQTEKNISCGDFALHYSFIDASEEEPVTYSDMANTLREFLVKEGRLVKTDAAKEAVVKTNLQMLMTTKVDSMIAKFLQTMTTCENIEDMVNSIEDSEAKSQLRIMLLGWQSSGYNIYPSTGKAANGIGSIEKLNKFFTENGIESYFVDDFISATTESDDFSKQTDAVYNEAKLPVTNSKGNQYVRNPYKEYKTYVDKTLSYYKKNKVTGVGFDKLGWYVFDDYQKNVVLSRKDVVAVYNAFLAKTHECGMKNAVQRGNAYVLTAADYLYDIPTTGSKREIIDREVPFYQMIVHGYVPYSLDIPGNMSIDYDAEKLKWIEFGAEPMFLLTEEMSEKFKDSKVENAFSTELSNWFDDVVAISEEFNSKLAFTGNNTIKEHKILDEGVIRLTYSNGNKIYINYNQKKATADDIKISAKNYVVVNADGKIVG